MKLPALQLSPGQAETLKWLALGCMVIDHTNKYLFSGTSEMAFALGRLAMPLFGILLAFNLAQPCTDSLSRYKRVAGRIGLSAAASTLPFVALGGLLWGWWPLNILFALLIAVIGMYLIEQGGHTNLFTAALLVIVGGALVEFWWPAIGVCIFAWAYIRIPTWFAGLGLVFSLAALYFINGNHWALMVLPVFFACAKINFEIPRIPYFFYYFYPLHLSVIYAVKQYSGVAQ